MSLGLLLFNFQRPPNCKVNVFKFEQDENDSIEYQCIDIDLICSSRTNQCESSDLMKLGNRIVIHKGTPIICDSKLYGVISEAFYETGYVMVEGILNFDKTDLLLYKPEIINSKLNANVDGYQSLRTAFF